MTRFNLFLRSLILLLTHLHAFSQPAAILLKNATLIDGTGSAPRANVDIMIRDGRIADIQKGLKASGAKEIDLAGKTIIPSLICAHAHVGTLKVILRPQKIIPAKICFGN